MVSSGTASEFETRGNMHYRSGLNMIPLMEWYRADPNDFCLLEIAMGAQTGQLVNIEPETGAPSMMLHVLPHILEYDPHSGDFGLGFFGHTLQTGAYYVDHPMLGALCFQCLVIEDSDILEFEVMDSFRIRVFMEPLAMYIELDTGTMHSVSMDVEKKTVTVTMDSDHTPTYSQRRLRVSKTSDLRTATNFKVVSPSNAKLVRNAYQFTGDAAVIEWE